MLIFKEKELQKKLLVEKKIKLDKKLKHKDFPNSQ